MIFDSWGGVLADGAFQEFSLAYTRARAGAAQARARRPRACRASSSPRAAACGWRRSPPAARRGRPRLDGQPRPGARRASATAWRCRATSTRTCCSRRPKQIARRGASRCSTASAAAARRRRLRRPRLQPRPRHQPAHAARARGGAGRDGAPATRARCAAAADRLRCRTVQAFAVSERSGLDLSPNSARCADADADCCGAPCGILGDRAKSLDFIEICWHAPKSGNATGRPGRSSELARLAGRFPTKLSTDAVDSCEKPFESGT